MDSSDPFLAPERDPREYRVERLDCASVSNRGIVHRTAAGEAVLPWEGVARGIAAMVGEPEGVSTIVFDLLLEDAETHIRVCRLDADPADGAIPLAVALADHLGPERSGASLLEMAAKGGTELWFPDLESFESAAAGLLCRSVRKGPVEDPPGA